MADPSHSPAPGSPPPDGSLTTPAGGAGSSQTAHEPLAGEDATSAAQSQQRVERVAPTRERGPLDLFRVYFDPDEIGSDGYPLEWHRTIKYRVREQAGNRCVRCGHPYRRQEHGNGEWSPCDERCDHAGPQRVWNFEFEEWIAVDPGPAFIGEGRRVEARWRILTVHHLTGEKTDCRWWNLVALCQRCHLSVQSRVKMERDWPWEHSGWFRPHVAGYYAWRFLGEDLSRAEVEARLDELLDLGGNSPRLFA